MDKNLLGKYLHSSCISRTITVVLAYTYINNMPAQGFRVWGLGFGPGFGVRGYKWG